MVISKLSAVAAVGYKRIMGPTRHELNGIESNVSFPWEFEPHLERLRHITSDKAVIIGRHSMDIFSNGKSLSTSRRIVMTKTKLDTNINGCQIARNIRQAVERAGNAEEIIVTGGYKTFKEFLPFVKTVYLTLVHYDSPGSLKFPCNSFVKEWNNLFQKTYHPTDQSTFTFFTYQRP